MAAFSGLYSLIRLYAKGVPEETMDLAIRHSVREFCRRTWWYQRSLTVPLTANTAYYELDSGVSDDEIIGIKAVETEDSVPLYPVTQEMVKFQTGDPMYWIFLAPSTMEVNPYPPADAVDLMELRVRVALQPTEESIIIPTEIMREHDHCIADGAIWYLTSMPQEIWSNDKVADMRMRLYYEKISNAKGDALFGKAHRDNSIQLQAFNV